MSTHTIHSWATMMARRLRMCEIMLYLCICIHRTRMRQRRRMRRAHTSAHYKNNLIAVGTNKYNDVAHATTCANVHTQRLRRLQDTHATTYTVTNTNTHIQHHDSAKNKKPTATLSNANENDNDVGNICADIETAAKPHIPMLVLGAILNIVPSLV